MARNEPGSSEGSEKSHAHKELTREATSEAKRAAEGAQPGRVSAYRGKALQSAEYAWDTLRSSIGRASEPITPEALLRQTEESLHHIIACVLQVSRKDASRWAEKLGKTIAAKLAATGATTSLLGVVAAFGTAGTGTAISTLSGAAATSATMAWVGGLVGGGMAAGTFLTAGVGVVVGYAAYKALGAKARPIEELTEIDKSVVAACGALAQGMREALEKAGADDRGGLSEYEAEMLLRNALRPLYVSLNGNLDDICSRLSYANAIDLRRRALPAFERAVQAFSNFVSRDERAIRRRSTNRIEYAVASVVYTLLSSGKVAGDHESQLVLAALRRSDPDIANASEQEISEYLRSYSADALKRIASNVKGIYHELLYVEDYNATHVDTYAELASTLNHPGSDIWIKDAATHDVVREVQLKATDSAAYVLDHTSRYPEVGVLATEEVAEKLPNVDGTGISNAEIGTRVHAELSHLVDGSIANQMIGSVGLAGLIAAGRQAIELLRGERSPDESAKSVAEAATTAAVSTWIAAFLFSQ